MQIYACVRLGSLNISAGNRRAIYIENGTGKKAGLGLENASGESNPIARPEKRQSTALNGYTCVDMNRPFYELQEI